MWKWKTELIVSFTLLFTTNNNFNLLITNFPFPSNYIRSLAMVFLFHTLHDMPGFASYFCFVVRATQLSNKLFTQECHGIFEVLIKEVYDRYCFLIQQHKVPSPEFYMPLWSTIMYNDNLHRSDNTLTHDLATEFDFEFEKHIPNKYPTE